MAADPGPFRLGVNYWPASTAMAWLADYDAAATRRDFRRIAGAGFDTIRVFLRWEDAQPTARRIDHRVLKRLVDAADAATEAGVALIVTLFTGHMSGVNWIPPWAVGGATGDPRFRVVTGGRVEPSVSGLRNWYSDADLVAAQERLAAAAAGALAGHPAVWAWDLGNENSNCTLPPDKPTAEAWLQRMTRAIRRSDPGRLLTVGIHMEDLEEDRGIGPAEVARWCDFVSMHGYPIYAVWSGGPADTRVVPFLELLTRWLAGGTPVLFEEFGLPTVPVAGPVSSMAVDERLAAEYTGSVIDHPAHAGRHGGGAVVLHRLRHRALRQRSAGRGCPRTHLRIVAGRRCSEAGRRHRECTCRAASQRAEQLELVRYRSRRVLRRSARPAGSSLPPLLR